ncbi:hypothetical protein FRB91_001248 [Serendipita sp. 411]|nr:hypothetical protein FRB91_001248 [Serendipita sp. 411]
MQFAIGDARTMGNSHAPTLGVNEAHSFHNNGPRRFFCRQKCGGVAECMESFPSRELLVRHWEQIAKWTCTPCQERASPSTTSSPSTATTPSPVAFSAVTHTSSGTSLRRSARLKRA